MKNKYFYSIIVVLLIAVSILTVILSNNNDSNTEIVDKFEIINDDYLNGFKKIKGSLKEQSPNHYIFENMKLSNGDLILLNEKNKGLGLKTGDYVDIDLSIMPAGKSATVVGYILDGNYTEIFSDSITDQLSTSFEVEEDGEYMICIIGFNANYIIIEEGFISIN